MKARRKGSLGYIILTILEKAVDGCVRFNDFTYHHYRYHYGISELRKSELAKIIRRLRDQGLIEEVRLKDDILIKLTSAVKEIMGGEPKVWDNT